MLRLFNRWNPIETAPKDGTIILGFIPEYWIPGGDYKNKERTYCYGVMRWDGEDDWGWSWHCLDGDIENPTHWKHLPKPPNYYKTVILNILERIKNGFNNLL